MGRRIGSGLARFLHCGRNPLPAGAGLAPRRARGRDLADRGRCRDGGQYPGGAFGLAVCSRGPSRETGQGTMRDDSSCRRELHLHVEQLVDRERRIPGATVGSRKVQRSRVRLHQAALATSPAPLTIAATRNSAHAVEAQQREPTATVIILCCVNSQISKDLFALSTGVPNCFTNKSRKTLILGPPIEKRSKSVCNGDAVGAWHGCGQGGRDHTRSQTGVVSDLWSRQDPSPN